MFCLDCFASQSNTWKRYFEALDLDISSLGRGNTSGFKMKLQVFAHTDAYNFVCENLLSVYCFAKTIKNAAMFRA